MDKIFNINTYNYELNQELIAQEPANHRDESRLMIVDKEISDKKFSDIIDYFQKDDVIVINKTKVLKFKLYTQKASGSKIEITILNENIRNYNETKTLFKCKVKGRNPRAGALFKLDNKTNAKIIKQIKDDFFLEFYNENKIMNFDDLNNYCNQNGFYPLPHYIKEQKKDSNYQERYQSVFAQNKGSIAAPTASLHFTKEIIKKLKSKGVIFAELTLHISYSTFKPIRNDDIRTHELDAEFIEIDHKNATIINNAKKNVIAIGTTVLKSLESITNKQGIIKEQKIDSNLFIYPSYKFKSKANKLLTNFHLPKSSLILLTSAFASWPRLKKAYEHATKLKYRFFSFGDAMLITKYQN